MKTILQIPLDKQLKSNAEKAASRQGFSSLQEIIRVFLTQLATNKVAVALKESITLSSENEGRYEQITRDFESGRNIQTASHIKDLMSKLNAD